MTHPWKHVHVPSYQFFECEVCGALVTGTSRRMHELWHEARGEQTKQDSYLLCHQVSPGTEDIYCHFEVGHIGPHSWHYPHPFATPQMDEVR